MKNFRKKTVLTKGTFRNQLPSLYDPVGLFQPYHQIISNSNFKKYIHHNFKAHHS